MTAAAGPVVGAELCATWVVAAEGYSPHTYLWDVSLTGSIIGGALALPFTAWTLPRVPIGRILSATAAGTVVGTLTGALFVGLDALGPMIGGILGFGSATSWLGFRASRPYEPE